MYEPVATPLSATAASIMAARAHIGSGAGTTARPASTASPMTITLLTVPMPGRCRSGSQSSRTPAPTMITIQPNRSPVRSLTPWWNTSHGSRPRLARMNIAMLTP